VAKPDANHAETVAGTLPTLKPKTGIRDCFSGDVAELPTRNYRKSEHVVDFRGWYARCYAMHVMDRTLCGKRCHTVRTVAHHRGRLPRETAGTIRYALENIGRTLVFVDFDSGPSLMVLPDDISLEGPEKTVEG